MKRRSFLKAVGATTLPLTIDNFSLKAMSPGPMLARLLAMATATDHVLVLIDLNGGNDGLNTVIPIDQYSNLSKARSNVLIPQNKVLKLNGTNLTGLHPSLPGIQQLYNDGKLHIVQNVGYENQNFSHFRSADIWFTASDHNEYLSSGMAGRYLNLEYPGFPNGYPNSSVPDPLGIQVGSLLNVLFQGPSAQMGIAINNPDEVFNLVPGIADTAPNGYPGDQLNYIRLVAQQTSSYTKTISTAAKKVTTQGTYPDTGLAKQLKVVAKLVAGGLQTRLYMVSLGGFDTHSVQTEKTDTTKGVHANLLKTLNDAIVAFQNDLQGLGVANKVVGMTVSEFGRRIKSNDSQGTDHGSAAPQFIFGNPVNGGKITGSNPSIAANVTVNDNLDKEYDFRSLYASLLRDWLCLNDDDVRTVLQKDFPYLPLIKQSCSTAGVNPLRFEGEPLVKCWPNPFRENATISYRADGTHTVIELMDYSGRSIRQVVNEDLAPGVYTRELDVSELAAGQYIVRYMSLHGMQSIFVVKL